MIDHGLQSVDATRFRFDFLRSGTLNFTEFVNMLTDYGKITSSSPARKEKVHNFNHQRIKFDI
jgi:hypothetical protein